MVQDISNELFHACKAFGIYTACLRQKFAAWPGKLIPSKTPRSRPCSLEEQYFKCGIFWDYDAPQRRVSNSEAPVLAGGIHVFLRGSQFSGASELKEELVSTSWHKFLNVKSARSWLPPRSLGTNAQCMERKGGNNIFAKHAISLCKHKQD